MSITDPRFFAETVRARRAQVFPWQTCILGPCIGVAVALLAWYPGDWRIALIALPATWSMVRSRVAALMLWCAYYLTGARDIPLVCERFFAGYGELSRPEGFALGVTFWAAQAALLALPWVLLKPASTATASSHARRAVLATLLVTVPPLGIIGWLSPVHLASALYPGWRLSGLTLGLITLAVAAAVSRSRCARIICVAMLATSIAARWQETVRPTPVGWTAVNTTLGKFDQSNYASLYARSANVQRIVQRAFDTHAAVAVLPEEVIGLWRPAMRFWWQMDIEDMRADGRTLVIGADLAVSTSPFRYTDSAVITGAGHGRFDSREPVPAALWRPGAKVSAVRGDLWQQYPVVAGQHVAFSLCYEDLLWWPHWRTLLDRPDVIVSISNGWFDADLALAAIQRQGIDSVARLAGAPLLRATNR